MWSPNAFIKWQQYSIAAYFREASWYANTYDLDEVWDEEWDELLDGVEE